MTRKVTISLFTLVGGLLFFDIFIRLTANEVEKNCLKSIDRMCQSCDEVLDKHNINHKR
jgi:hypothetical protein